MPPQTRWFTVKLNSYGTFNPGDSFPDTAHFDDVSLVLAASDGLSCDSALMVKAEVTYNGAVNNNGAAPISVLYVCFCFCVCSLVLCFAFVFGLLVCSDSLSLSNTTVPARVSRRCIRLLHTVTSAITCLCS